MDKRSPFLTPIQTASTDIDNILCELITHVKKFKCPSELDFLKGTQNGLLLLNSEKNRPFINQLRKFDGLRTRLAKVQTHGNEQLEAKRRATDMAIRRALFRMKEYQLKLYDKYTEAY
ncbi:hypothetical protein ACGC1H_004181 [Rhizoctonia solani]|uniref:Uncharacterized protein n=1 Tax=Rhizoctonia solani TaxID=456999 RepID=A0A8H3BW70_9AGAM|nr:unnamed protein product [Rhizoctonia solani]